MPRTVVVLPVAGEVLPAAALPAMRAAERVYADATVPEKAAIAAGAVAGAPAGADWVLLTTDLTQAPEADEVIGAPRGAALLDAVAVMDRLRSPGGCPWDAEQTHESLLPYLVEECYELYQAIEDGDGTSVGEELGDVLLQVLFHARVAADGEWSFDIDDVAGGLVAKLVGRHPHVFAGSESGHGADRHRGAPGAPLGGTQAGREAARLQRGRRSAGPAGRRVGGEADQPDGARRPARRTCCPPGPAWGSGCSPTRPGPSWPATTRRRRCARRPAGSPTTCARRSVRRATPAWTRTRSMPTPGAPTGRLSGRPAGVGRIPATALTERGQAMRTESSSWTWRAASVAWGCCVAPSTAICCRRRRRCGRRRSHPVDGRVVATVPQLPHRPGAAR